MSYVITDTGLNLFVNALGGSSTISYWIESGANPSSLTAEATDIALFQEVTSRQLATITTSTTTTTGDTLNINGSYTNSTSTPMVLGECGVGNSSTVPGTSLVSDGTVIGSTTGTTLTTTTALDLQIGAYIQIRSEVMQVTAGIGTTNLTVTRGKNNTTAISTIVANDPVAIGNPPGTSTTTGGNLLFKADFGESPITLDQGDTITYSWSLVLQ